jgi:hypothetical protein
MLTVYLICLVVGGVFVALSALGAIGKDIDTDTEALEAGDGIEHALDAAHDHALSVSDASQGLAPHEPTRRRVWLPVLSFRFWTYGSACFGLVGTLLSMVTAASPLFVALASAATGVGIGTLSAWVVRFLRRPVGASLALADYRGQVGELESPLRPGGITRIRLRVHERERSMLAVATEPIELATGTRVLVLGIDERGRAEIEPEESIYKEE